jgi:hypothetical protein
LIGTMIALTSAAALLSASTAIPGSGRFGDEYKPVPRGLLTDGEILFTHLRASQLTSVRETPTDAVRIADASYGAGGVSRVVLVSLGGYVDKNQIVHDWIGTTSLVPKATPSYVVRIFEPNALHTLDPSKNHYWNVIVNARSGRIIAAITYD